MPNNNQESATIRVVENVIHEPRVNFEVVVPWFHTLLRCSKDIQNIVPAFKKSLLNLEGKTKIDASVKSELDVIRATIQQINTFLEIPVNTSQSPNNKLNELELTILINSLTDLTRFIGVLPQLGQFSTEQITDYLDKSGPDKVRNLLEGLSSHLKQIIFQVHVIEDYLYKDGKPAKQPSSKKI